MNLKGFGKKVKEKRINHKLTRAEVAELCNMHEGYLGQIENGYKMPSLPMLLTICRELHTSPNFLLEFAEDTDIQEIVQIIYALSPTEIKAVKHLICSYQELKETEKYGDE